MTVLILENLGEQAGLHCPSCGSDVLYRNGHSWTGKQRWLCLICKRQFSQGAGRRDVRKGPACPQCRQPMYLYKKEPTVTRFRCSAYPRCRTYTSLPS